MRGYRIIMHLNPNDAGVLVCLLLTIGFTLIVSLCLFMICTHRIVRRVKVGSPIPAADLMAAERRRKITRCGFEIAAFVFVAVGVIVPLVIGRDSLPGLVLLVMCIALAVSSRITSTRWMHL